MTTPTTTTTPAAGAPAGGGAAGAPAPTDAISQALALEAKPAETKQPAAETKKTEGETKQPAAETKPADAPKDEKKDPPKEGEKKEEKPAALEVKVPEGFEVDKPALEAFKAFAAKNELKPEVAQGVFDQYVAIEKARVDATEKAFAEQDSKWVAEIKADPDLGGEKWPATVRDVRAGVEHIGRPFAELIAKTGLGNNPTVVKELVRLGRANADDTIRGTEKPASTEPERLSDAEVFYGKKKSTTSAAKD